MEDKRGREKVKVWRIWRKVGWKGRIGKKRRKGRMNRMIRKVWWKGR